MSFQPEGSRADQTPRSKSGGGTDANCRFESVLEIPRSLRPIAPGNGSASPPPWDLDRSGGLFFAPWFPGSRPPEPPAGYSGLTMTAPLAPPGAERILRWIMVGIVIWGSIHALGAWTLNHDARRPVVVILADDAGGPPAPTQPRHCRRPAQPRIMPAGIGTTVAEREEPARR